MRQFGPLPLVFLQLSRLHLLPDLISSLSSWTWLVVMTNLGKWFYLSGWNRKENRQQALVLFCGLTPSCSWAAHRELTWVWLEKSGVLGRSHNFWQLSCKWNPSNLFLMVSVSIVERQSERKQSEQWFGKQKFLGFAPSLNVNYLCSLGACPRRVLQELISFLNALNVKMC